MPAINYWTNRKGKRLATKTINKILSNYIGHKLNPVDKLFLEMKKTVVKYFKDNPDQLNFFSNGNQPFDYNFEVEEQNGYVTKVTFQT